MPWVEEWEPGKVLQCLVYGKSKIGKTFGAYSFPRPVVFDFDKGIAVASNPEFIKRYGVRKIFYEQFTERATLKGVPKDHNAFDDACRLFDEWMKPQGKWKNVTVGVNMFDTFIIDSGTTLSDVAQNKAVVLLGKPGVWGKNPLSQTHANAMTTGLVVPRLQDFGAERSLVEQFVQMILDSGKNVVMICHEYETINDETGAVVSVEPLLTGKSREAVPLKFDEVYNLQAKLVGTNIERRLTTEPKGGRKAGSRNGVPDGTLWDYTTIINALTDLNKQRDSLLAQGKQLSASTGP